MHIIQHRAADARSENDSSPTCPCLVCVIALVRQNEPLPSVERSCKGGLTVWQMRRLNAYVDQNMGMRIRTLDLAALLALSTSHFSRTFKQSNGIPPRVYIVRRRIAAACTMMLTTQQALTEIAHIHGFCDQSHFNRAFHQEIGTAPQEWRRLNQAAQMPLMAGSVPLMSYGEYAWARAEQECIK